MSNEKTKNTDEQQVIETITQERDEWKDKCLRIAADFENYKKRSGKERGQWQLVITNKVLTDVLNVIDDVERALAAHKENEPLILMHKQLLDMLKLYNVQPITQVEVFDPALHEAVARVASDQHESDAIIEVLQKGYRRGDQVVRVAKVAVAQ